MSDLLKTILAAIIVPLAAALIAWGTLSARMDETSKRVDRLETEWGQRFDRLENKIDRVLERQQTNANSK